MTMEVLADWVSRISNVVWNGLLLYLLVGTGIVFTIRTRFIQVRKVRRRLEASVRPFLAQR